MRLSLPPPSPGANFFPPRNSLPTSLQIPLKRGIVGQQSLPRRFLFPAAARAAGFLPKLITSGLTT
jgi:hypothetical protein